MDWWTDLIFTDAQLRFRRPAAGWCVANPLPWLVQDWWARDLYCQRDATWEHGDCRTQRWKSKRGYIFFLGRIFSQSHRLGTFSGFLPNFGGMFGTVFEKTPNGWDLRRPTLAQNIGSNTNKHIGLSHLGMSMQELVSIFGIRQYSSAVISCSSNHLLR